MEVKVGVVNDYFAKVSVAAFFPEQELKVGDIIHIKGHTTDLTQTIESIQIDRNPVQIAEVGSSVGIKVNDRVRKGDVVYKVI